MSLGKAIKHIRTQQRLTQSQVAQDAGIPSSYLSRIENDRIQPTTGTLARLSQALSVPTSRLFSVEEKNGLPVIPHCPVSSSGRCIGDMIRAKATQLPVHSEFDYGPDELRYLRMANFLVLSGTPQVKSALGTVLQALVDQSEPSAFDSLLPDDLARHRNLDSSTGQPDDPHA